MSGNSTAAALNRQGKSATSDIPQPDKQQADRRKWLNKKKNDFYRFSRKLHTYVSAAAFLLLMFFALSGLMLNHPEWFQSSRPVIENTVQLSPEAVRKAITGPMPADTLAELLSAEAALPGALYNHEDLGDGYQLEYRGLGGNSSAFIDTETGLAEISVRTNTLTDKIHALHKGKNTGAAWAAIIDLSAYLTLALSLFGFIILFTVKMRLKNSLRMITVSAGFLGFIIWYLVP